jgi:hypothetical protein
MAQLLQYRLSDGRIWGIYTSNTQALLEAQIVAGDPTYGYLFPVSPIEVRRQGYYEVISNVVVLKTTFRITASPSPFVADGVKECSITVSPFVECSITVNGTSTALTTGDQTLLLTADTPQSFRVALVVMPGYVAEDILIEAVAATEATLAATGALALGGAEALTASAASLQATGGVAIHGNATLTTGAASVSSAASVTTILTAALTLAHAQLTGTSILLVLGSSALSMAAMTEAGTGTLPLQGLLALPLTASSLASAGVLPLVGTVQQSLGAHGLSSTASLAVTGVSTMAVSILLLEASGSPPRVGASSMTMDSMSAMGQGA